CARILGGIFFVGYFDYW
nr:immunoglobulin heavy chain junction region [Macaca mulatta]MOW32409.1 immunoglobulin heavy chain junction region [Macaca mulatta]MOW32414.1 immunoglobulin heavy chain junction region [Macaca mulatta]MOW32989.1 immunoglobulin heavy chain junction region [Macaca mulatta]MOW33550.1 immunoglobulin heavy chain junction region [Macaca mulatta]